MTPPCATLPALALEAVVSGRTVDLAALGRPAVFVFHGQDTAGAAMAVHAAVRTAHPDPDAVFMASVIDLRAFPSMFHGMVKPELEKAYHKAAAGLPAGADPADWVVLLPDWKGAAHDACGVSDSTRRAAVLVADAAGRVVAHSQDPDPATAALAALADLTA